jgi:hypothetical protein
MAQNRRLESDKDFQEAMEKQHSIRVFQDDHIVDSDSVIIRFTDDFIVTQSSVSEITYHHRKHCEFFGKRSK